MERDQIHDRNENTRPEKLLGYEFYRQVLKSPKYVMAPMVDGSDLAYRLFGRKYGVDLAYTEMVHTQLVPISPAYRKKYLSTHPDDTPLIVQFASRDPAEAVTAGLAVQDMCSAVDMNLGCPQQCARKGGYGAFLMSEPELVCAIVAALHRELSVPVTCKIRIYPPEEGGLEQTIKFARELYAHGCQMLCVHGRTKYMKGPLLGRADWEAIAAVRRALPEIPMIANGSIYTYEDAQQALLVTGCDAVMSADGILQNPYLFAGPTEQYPTDPIKQFNEYLSIAEALETPRRFIAMHAQYLLTSLWDRVPHLRSTVTSVKEIGQWHGFVNRVEEELKKGSVPEDYLAEADLLDQKKQLKKQNAGADLESLSCLGVFESE
jgi:tRNA-dihydrouridine synthase 1